MKLTTKINRSAALKKEMEETTMREMMEDLKKKIFLFPCGNKAEERARLCYALLKLDFGVRKELSLINENYRKNPIPNAVFSIIPEMKDFTEENVPALGEFMKSYEDFGAVAMTGSIYLDEERRIGVSFLQDFEGLLINHSLGATEDELDEFQDRLNDQLWTLEVPEGPRDCRNED